MSQVAASVDHRARVLRALGVTPWQRRATSVPATLADVVAAAGASTARCAVILPKGCTSRELDLLGRALYAFGPDLARAARIEAGNGEMSGVPTAEAYLALGEPQAHALGRALAADVLQKAHIVLADTPTDMLGSAAAKRRLWNALRGLRRALAIPAG